MSAAGSNSSHSVSDKGGRVICGNPAGMMPTVVKLSCKPKVATSVAATTAHNIGPIRVSGWVFASATRALCKSRAISGRLIERNTSATSPKARAVTFALSSCAATPKSAVAGFVGSSMWMPVRPGNWLMMMSIAAALTKPLMTGWLSSVTRSPILVSLNTPSINPTCKHNSVVMPK